MKKCLVEMLGTSLLAMAITLTGNPLAIGLMLTACLVFGAHISGGHFNPAVSLMLFIHQKINLHTFLKYTGCQIAGGIIALTLFRIIVGSVFIPDITAGLNIGILFTVEAILTCLFCLVVLTLIEKKGINNNFDPHAAILMGVGLMSIAFIGGIFNPAIVIGSIVHQIIEGSLSMSVQQMIIQIAGPLVGATGAHYLYKCIN